MAPVFGTLDLTKLSTYKKLIAMKTSAFIITLTTEVFFLHIIMHNLLQCQLLALPFICFNKYERVHVVAAVAMQRCPSSPITMPVDEG